MHPLDGEEPTEMSRTLTFVAGVCIGAAGVGFLASLLFTADSPLPRVVFPHDEITCTFGSQGKPIKLRLDDNGRAFVSPEGIVR